MTVEIVYETHAPTPDNAKGVISGWNDTPLADEGRLLALQLGARRRDTGIDAVFSSDFRRAAETAEIAFASVGVPLHRDVRLRECNYGELNGCPAPVLDAARAAHVDKPFPGGGQSFRQVLDATADFLHDLRAGWDGARVLVIAHSANKWSLDCLLTGAVLEDLVSSPFVWREGWEYTA